MSYESKRKVPVVVRTMDERGRAEYRVLCFADGAFVVERNAGIEWKSDKTDWRRIYECSTRKLALVYLAGLEG